MNWTLFSSLYVYVTGSEYGEIPLMGFCVTQLVSSGKAEAVMKARDDGFDSISLKAIDGESDFCPTLLHTNERNPQRYG